MYTGAVEIDYDEMSAVARLTAPWYPEPFTIQVMLGIDGDTDTDVWLVTDSSDADPREFPTWDDALKAFLAEVGDYMRDDWMEG